MAGSKLRADEAEALHYTGERMHAWLHELRRRGPVVQVPFAGAPAWLILGHAALRDAFKDEQAFPAGAQYRRTIEPSQGRTFQGVDGPEHRVLRTLATPAFRPRALRGWEDELEPLAHELVDRFAAEERVDLVARFTAVYPFLVITRLLGIPREREAELHGWATRMLRFDEGANREFGAFLRPVLAARRREPRDDVISGLLHAEFEGRRFRDEEVLAHLRLLFSAGATTTFDALGSLLFALLTRSEVLARVKEEEGAIDLAVEELLRWETPVANLPRVTLTGARVAGVSIPPKATLLFSITGANHDPEVFLAPERFDLDRDTSAKLTFGLGSHSCPGLHLARSELRVAAAVLLARLADLALLDPEAAAPRGFVLRGPPVLPVRFRPA